jgi:hypothetical protein
MTTETSYATGIVGRICDCFFGELYDLEQEFEDFYKLEYRSFAHFLFWKYGLPERTIKSILADKTEERIIAIGNASGGGDYTLSQMTDDEVWQKLFATMFDLDHNLESEGEDDDYEDEE